jgi:hypothetical protein
MTATRPARLPRPVPAGQGRSDLKRGGPGTRPRVKRVAAPPRAGNGPGIPPVTQQNAMPDRVPGMIEGHQGLISPIMTRNHYADMDYGSICSIYPVRFAVSTAAVDLMTRNHGPSVTGTFTRSETEPEFCVGDVQNSHNNGPEEPLMGPGPRSAPDCAPRNFKTLTEVIRVVPLSGAAVDSSARLAAASAVIG